jgi:glyoxylase-like metal-dependent hydrolase (beta-lactamase superfamily II)
MGDTPLVTVYEDYRDYGGVKFPARIRQSQGGFPVLDLQVGQVQPNAPAAIEVPALVASFAERVVPEKVADGVWFLAGGSHNSVLVEMADHLMLVESPLYDGRAQAVLAAARQLVPGKPVRYVVNSHHHFDHAGGLRAAAAEGAVVVTSGLAQPWFSQALSNPNSVSPDALAKSGRQARVEGVEGRRIFDDGRRVVEVHSIDGSVHAQGFVMVWMPRERLLVQADAFTPAAPGAAPPATPNGNHVNLVQNIERLGLNVDRILPLHGRVVPMSELLAAIGRR